MSWRQDIPAGRTQAACSCCAQNRLEQSPQSTGMKLAAQPSTDQAGRCGTACHGCVTWCLLSLHMVRSTLVLRCCCCRLRQRIAQPLVLLPVRCLTCTGAVPVGSNRQHSVSKWTTAVGQYAAQCHSQYCQQSGSGLEVRCYAACRVLYWGVIGYHSQVHTHWADKNALIVCIPSYDGVQIRRKASMHHDEMQGLCHGLPHCKSCTTVANKQSHLTAIRRP
jgi:hypothetical protein